MAEQFLDDAHGGPSFEQRGGDAVPKSVQADAGDAGLLGQRGEGSR